jgi:hypothetical protein
VPADDEDEEEEAGLFVFVLVLVEAAAGKKTASMRLWDASVRTSLLGAGPLCPALALGAADAADDEEEG